MLVNNHTTFMFSSVIGGTSDRHFPDSYSELTRTFSKFQITLVSRSRDRSTDRNVSDLFLPIIDAFYWHM